MHVTKIACMSIIRIPRVNPKTRLELACQEMTKTDYPLLLLVALFSSQFLLECRGPLMQRALG